MLLGFSGVRKAARRFNDDLRPDGFPRQRRRILLFEYLDDFAVDRNAVRSSGYRVGQIAEYRIVFQQVSESLRIGEIVDGYELDILILKRRAQNIPSNTAKSINPYLYSHVSSEREIDCDRRTAE